MKLKNKVAVVTGGSRGIGAAIAKAYAKEGATVIIINKNHPEDGREVAEQIRRGGGRAEAMTCDVCDPIAIQQLVATVIDAHHRIDVLVHCAGVLVSKNLAELASDGINVNMISPGFTATPMNQELRHDPHFMAQIKKPPSGESVMSPERLAGAAVYLASEDAKCVHGLDLVVDGGATVVQ